MRGAARSRARVRRSARTVSSCEDWCPHPAAQAEALHSMGIRLGGLAVRGTRGAMVREAGGLVCEGPHRGPEPRSQGGSRCEGPPPAEPRRAVLRSGGARCRGARCPQPRVAGDPGSEGLQRGGPVCGSLTQRAGPCSARGRAPSPPGARRGCCETLQEEAPDRAASGSASLHRPQPRSRRPRTGGRRSAGPLQCGGLQCRGAAVQGPRTPHPCMGWGGCAASQSEAPPVRGRRSAGAPPCTRPSARKPRCSPGTSSWRARRCAAFRLRGSALARPCVYLALCPR